MNLLQKMEKRVYIIAEMSANHSGRLNRAKEIIYAAKEAGADCIKIQTYTADTMTIDCNNEYFHIANGTWAGENLYSLYNRAYTPWEWQAELKAEAESVGLDFLSTAFDKTSVDFLEKIGIEFYKIASFELVDIPLIKYVASKGKPIIMSTGMATLGEIQEAIAAARGSGGTQIVLLKCSSAYPAVSEYMNLKTISNMKETFQLPVGISDHSLGSVGAITAVALGANIVEKHFCISRDDESPDSSFSMEKEEFKKMVDDIRQTEQAIGQVNYETTEDEKNSIDFRRSIFVVQDIEQGEMLTEANVKVIRPGQGLAPKYYEDVVGQKALRRLTRGTPLQNDMIGRL